MEKKGGVRRGRGKKVERMVIEKNRRGERRREHNGVERERER